MSPDSAAVDSGIQMTTAEGTGGAFSYQNPYAESGLKVYTEYDAGGNLTGLRV